MPCIADAHRPYSVECASRHTAIATLFVTPLGVPKREQQNPHWRGPPHPSNSLCDHTMLVATLLQVKLAQALKSLKVMLAQALKSDYFEYLIYWSANNSSQKHPQNHNYIRNQTKSKEPMGWKDPYRVSAHTAITAARWCDLSSQLAGKENRTTQLHAIANHDVPPDSTNQSQWTQATFNLPLPRR